MTSANHLAAILPSAGANLEIVQRPTPTPGPDELLIEVKSLAINPVDFYQRATGLFITKYPTILGSDIAGIVVSAGSSVPEDVPKPGSRVAAFASAFFQAGAPDYGAFQTYVVCPAVAAVQLPDHVTFSEGSLLGMAVMTSWTGWYTIGLPYDKPYTAADKKTMLVWGAATSIGSAAVQIAKLMGYTVYATASAKQHEYIKGLGAATMFDYKDKNVVDQIVQAANHNGLEINIAYDAAGSLQECVDVLKALKGEGVAKIASAPRVPDEFSQIDDVEVKFVFPPTNEKERLEFAHHVFSIWLKEKLATGEFVPSPKIRLVEGGLESINKALDEWKKGVSGEKIVLQL
jgi:NADPH:quinone reductase-like Zn-dependent oxidoreductase